MRFWRQAWRDLVWLGLRIKEMEGVMKVITPLSLFVAAVLGASAFIKPDWWLTPVKTVPISLAAIILLGLILVIDFYFGFVFARSRRPLLAIGRLRPDEKEGSNCFHMKVQNLGPGSLQPVVNLTYLADEDGKLLPMKSAYRDCEIHWRYFTEPNKRPVLDEGGKAYAGVFLMNDIDSDAPRLWLYPIDLQPQPLWSGTVPLEKQKGLRVKLTVAYRANGLEMIEGLVVERNYYMKADKRCPLRYKAKRVYIRSWFWR